MNTETRKELRNKSRYLYGLANILKSDVEMLRGNVNDFNLDKTKDCIRETNITLQKLALVVNQIDQIVKTDILEGP